MRRRAGLRRRQGFGVARGEGGEIAGYGLEGLRGGRNDARLQLGSGGDSSGSGGLRWGLGSTMYKGQSTK